MVDVIPGENEVYDAEDSDSDSENVDTGFNNVIDSLTTYINCLLDSVPSLEQAAKDFVEFDETLILQAVPHVFEVSETARPYCRNIMDKFPKAALRLVERLGEANWERHSRVRERLENAPTADETIKVAPEDGCDKTVAGTLFHDSALGPSIMTAPTLFSDIGDTTSSAAAVNPSPARAASYATFTSFLSDETYGGSRGVRLPSPPDAALTGTPFRCQICGQFVRNLVNRIDWKYG